MISRFCVTLAGGLLAAVLAFGMILTVMPVTAWCQVPGYPQVQPAQPMPGPTGPPVQQQQRPQEYVFRPDLTNPEYGECLGLERNWQAMWHRYTQEYQRVVMMNPRDPNYGQMTRYLQGLKQQLDQAWGIFSSKCVYFPTRQ